MCLDAERTILRWVSHGGKYTPTLLLNEKNVYLKMGMDFYACIALKGRHNNAPILSFVYILDGEPVSN